MSSSDLTLQHSHGPRRCSWFNHYNTIAPLATVILITQRPCGHERHSVSSCEDCVQTHAANDNQATVASTCRVCQEVNHVAIIRMLPVTNHPAGTQQG